MKRSLSFLLSTLSVAALATGCVATADATSPTGEPSGTTSAASTTVAKALSLSGIGGTCGIPTTSLTFGGLTESGGQVYFFHANGFNFPQSGCTLNASMVLDVGFNVRVTGIVETGNVNYGPGASGEPFNMFGLETVGVSTIGAESTGGTGFEINYTSPSPNFPGLTGTSKCQNNPNDPVNVLVDPYITLHSGSSATASVSSLWVYLEVDPCAL